MDHEAIERARQGDRSALNDLLGRVRQPLLEAASRDLGPAVGARVRPSDLVQSALIEAIGELESFRGSTETDFVGWVTRILQNNLRDAARFHTAERRSVDRESPLESVDERLQAAHRTASSEAISTEEITRIGRAMQDLSADQRQILTLRLFQSRSHAEVAARMGRSVGACRVLYARARAALAVALGPEPGASRGPGPTKGCEE